MTDGNTVQGIFTLLALAGLVALFFTGWQYLIIDAVRHRIFQIRNNAFLWAIDNGRLDDAAYQEFREVTNATIRHFESVSFLQVVVFSKIFHLREKVNQEDIGFLKDKHLKREFERAATVCAAGVAARSPIIVGILALMLPILVPVTVFSFLMGNGRKPRKVFQNLSEEMRADILHSASPC